MGKDLLDEVLGWTLAAVGFYFQYTQCFSASGNCRVDGVYMEGDVAREKRHGPREIESITTPSPRDATTHRMFSPPFIVELLLWPLQTIEYGLLYAVASTSAPATA